jgi:hypothetical protein
MGFFGDLFAPKTTTPETVESVTTGIAAVQDQINKLKAAVETLKNTSVEKTEVVNQGGGARRSKKSRRRTLKNRRRR